MRHGDLISARSEGRSVQTAFWEGLRAVRLAFAAFITVDMLAYLVLWEVGAPEARDLSIGRFLGGVCGTLAAIAVMWGRWRIAAVLALFTFVAVPLAGPTGAEVYLLIAATVVATTRERPRRAALLVLALFTLVALYAGGLALLDLMPGPAGPAYRLKYYSIVVAISALATLPVRLFRKTYQERLETAQRRAAEAARIRQDERTRLSADLREVVETGLERITSLSAPADVDGAVRRRRLDAIADIARDTLNALRSLLGILRSTDGTDGTDTGPVGEVSRWWRRRGAFALPALAAGMGLGLFPLVIGPGLPIERFAVGCALLGLAVGGVDMRLGAALATVGTLSTVVVPQMGRLSSLVLGIVLAGLTGAMRSRKATAYLLGVIAAFALIEFAAYGVTASLRQATLGTGAAIGFAAGFTVAYVISRSRQAQADLRRVELANARAVSEDRAHVARELHDVVAHQLSLTALEVMALTGEVSAEEMGAGLGRIHRYAAVAERELDLLVEALDSPALLDDGVPLLAPVVVAENMRQVLAASGLQPHVAVDAGVADLDEISQRTLSRALQEATTNILRYAPPGSACHVALSVDGGSVTLRAANPLPAGVLKPDPLSTGWGLRGLRERVELCRGVVHAGATAEGAWLLEITLPLAAAGDAASAPTLSASARPTADSTSSRTPAIDVRPRGEEEPQPLG